MLSENVSSSLKLVVVGLSHPCDNATAGHIEYQDTPLLCSGSTLYLDRDVAPSRGRRSY